MSILTGIAEGLIVTTLDYHIIFWNDGACNLLGWTAEETRGKDLTSLINLNYKINLKDLMTSFGGHYYCQLKDFQLPSGEKKTLRLSFNIITDGEGNPCKIVILASDITELVQSQNEARQASLAKSRYLANISHEIRTPLLGILGYSELLSNQELSFLHRENVVMIQFCANQLLNLVNDILDLSRIEAKQIEITNKPFSLTNMIHQTALTIRPTMAKKQLDFQLEICPGTPDYILGDEMKLRQVLTNLLVNAVKYTDSGYIKLGVKGKPPTPELTSFLLEISVCDSGTGVSLDKMESIFEPYVQVDSSNSSSGVGLGLAICRQLVETMGGRLCHKPNPGGGSIFTFVVPVQETLAGTLAETLPNNTMAKVNSKPVWGKTVLLVEDIKVNRRLITLMLKERGYQVMEAENGRDCLQILQQIRPDTILMDMKMPIMDGYEATRIIRQSEKWKDIPIVALTAQAMTGDVDQCKKAGCDYYLSKPFSRAQLYNILDSCLGEAMEQDG